MIGHRVSILILLLALDLTHSGCPFRAIGRLTKSIHGGEKHAIADPETSTPNGCTCNSLCGATIEDGFTRDWCLVEGSCGEYILLIGYWDWCLYKDSSKPDYTALDWQTKHDQIWSEIKSDSTYGGFYPSDAFTESLLTTFENEWDIMPAGRRKA